MIIAGIFAKFAAAIVAIPDPVMGGMTTFLFSSVLVSGMAILSKVPFNRRNRFVFTASLALGYGATLVPNWFSYVFKETSNKSLEGFLDAIVLVLETGFAVTALYVFPSLCIRLCLCLYILTPADNDINSVAMILHNIMPEEAIDTCTIDLVNAQVPGEPDPIQNQYPMDRMDGK